MSHVLRLKRFFTVLKSWDQVHKRRVLYRLRLRLFEGVAQHVRYEAESLLTISLVFVPQSDGSSFIGYIDGAGWVFTAKQIDELVQNELVVEMKLVPK